MNEEINDLALEVVKRGIFPHQREKIEQLAKDADESTTTITLIAKRMVSITNYVQGLKNSKKGKSAQIDYLRAIAVKNAAKIESLKRENEQYLPLPEQWQAADKRSQAALKQRIMEGEMVSDHRAPEIEEMPLREVLEMVDNALLERVGMTHAGLK